MAAPEPETAPEAHERAPWLETDAAPARRRRGFFSRWLFRDRRDMEAAVTEPAVEPEPEPYEEPEAFVDPEPEPMPDPEPEPVATEQPDAAAEPAVEEEPAEPIAAAAVDESPGGVDEQRAREVLETVLDNLGSAHHRPFSRG